MDDQSVPVIGSLHHKMQLLAPLHAKMQQIMGPNRAVNVVIADRTNPDASILVAVDPPAQIIDAIRKMAMPPATPGGERDALVNVLGQAARYYAEMNHRNVTLEFLADVLIAEGYGRVDLFGQAVSPLIHQIAQVIPNDPILGDEATIPHTQSARLATAITYGALREATKAIGIEMQPAA